MSKDTIWTELQAVIRDVMDDEQLVITESTSAKDVPGWDSVTHVMLIVAIEKHFKIAKFSPAEIQSLKSVGNLLQIVEGRML